MLVTMNELDERGLVTGLQPCDEFAVVIHRNQRYCV